MTRQKVVLIFFIEMIAFLNAYQACLGSLQCKAEHYQSPIELFQQLWLENCRCTAGLPLHHLQDHLVEGTGGSGAWENKGAGIGWEAREQGAGSGKRDLYEGGWREQK